MPTLDEFAATVSVPTLRVQVRSRPEITHIVQHGATIGRAPHNAVVIDCCDVCAEHARVTWDGVRLRVSCVQDDFWFALQGGNEVRQLPLEDGAEFWIGDVKFRFQHVPVRIQVRDELSGMRVDSAVPPLAAVPVLPAFRASCPRCHDPLQRVPTPAKFCPKCGLELPEHCPPWDPGVGFDLSNPALLAYANALFNLGIRFENDGELLDVEQAKRYYEKAAKLGLTSAKARLEAQ